MTTTLVRGDPTSTTNEKPTAATAFSLELNDDQRQIQEWVHDFAAGVIRPAAHEWDEREETPWPIIEEAAQRRPVLPRLRGQRVYGPFRDPDAGGPRRDRMG